jgi:hypothetical protein
MANPYVDASAQQAQQFYNTLQQQQQLAFSQDQNALNAVSSMWAPVLQSGVIPYGYSPGLDNLLKANVIQTGTTATANATNAAALQQKQESGGANVLPTGANAQINAEIQAQGQQKIAQGLQQEKISGYQQGIENLEGATNAELGIAKFEDPTGEASAALGANKAEEEAGAEMWKENQSGGFGAILGDVTGAIGAGVGAATGIGDVGAMFSGAAGTAGPGAGAQESDWWNNGNPIS